MSILLGGWVLYTLMCAIMSSGYNYLVYFMMSVYDVYSNPEIRYEKPKQLHFHSEIILIKENSPS